MEDHPIVREGLAQLIHIGAHLRVVAEAANAKEAITIIGQMQLDLAIVDISLPSSSGLELIKQIRSIKPGLPVLVVSMHDEEIYAERCIRAGARGYVMKHEARLKIVEAIETVLSGQLYVSARMKEEFVNQVVGGKKSASLTDRLSDRELEVFELLGEGYSGPEIAAKLHLSVKTVESYRESLKAKLKVRSGPELLRRAIAWSKSEPRPELPPVSPG